MWSVCGRYVSVKAVGMWSVRVGKGGRYVAGTWSVNQINFFTITKWSLTPRKYVFDVTSIDERSSRAMDVQLSERRDEISPRVQAPFSWCIIYFATNALNERIWTYRG